MTGSRSWPSANTGESRTRFSAPELAKVSAPGHCSKVAVNHLVAVDLSQIGARFWTRMKTRADCIGVSGGLDGSQAAPQSTKAGTEMTVKL